MKTETNTKPLYKVLNEKRTGGIWELSSLDHTALITGDVPNHIDILSCDPKGSIKLFDRLPNYETAEANTKYTALAVNNIANCAEALELCVKLFKAMEEQMPDLPLLSHFGYQMTRDTAKEALKLIS